MLSPQFKKKTGWAIAILVALMSLTSLINDNHSDTMMHNVVSINGKWGMYQAKSIKQNIAKMVHIEQPIDLYESDPATGDGKVELFNAARKKEADHVISMNRRLYYMYTTGFFHMSLALISLGTISEDAMLIYISIALGALGILTFLVGLFIIKT